MRGQAASSEDGDEEGDDDVVVVVTFRKESKCRRCVINPNPNGSNKKLPIYRTPEC
jgi:hypothetical protein